MTKLGFLKELWKRIHLIGSKITKSVGDVITTRIYEVLKTGVKVAIDKDKKLIVNIKKLILQKMQLTQDLRYSRKIML